MKYRGRTIGEPDLGLIRNLIEEHPSAPRRELSRKLCQAWKWVQANGATCDMVCRGLMLALDRAGHITLPPPKGRPLNPLVVRVRPRCPEIDTSPMVCSLKELGPLEFRLVRRTPDEPVFNGLIEQYHYLSYVQPPPSLAPHRSRSGRTFAPAIGSRPVIAKRIVCFNDEEKSNLSVLATLRCRRLDDRLERIDMGFSAALGKGRDLDARFEQYRVSRVGGYRGSKPILVGISHAGGLTVKPPNIPPPIHVIANWTAMFPK